MDDCLVLFVVTVAQSKLSKLCRLPPLIFPRIDLHKESKTKGHTGNFPLLPTSIKQGLRTGDCGQWTGTAQCALIIKF